MNDPDERIHRYLRSRADVTAPADLRWPSTTEDARRLTGRWFAVRSVGSVAAVIVAAMIIGAVVLADYHLPAQARPAQTRTRRRV